MYKCPPSPNENITVLINHNPPKQILSYSLLKLCLAILLSLSYSLFLIANENHSANTVAESILKKSNKKAYFEQNLGQWDSSFYGLATASNMAARFYEDKISFVLKSDDGQDVFVYNMQLLNVSEDINLVFKNKKLSIKNYVGCVNAVPLFEEIRYENVYPNIDLRFYINENKELEFDYIVLPGGDPNLIQYSLDGVESLQVLQQGELSYCSPFGELRSSKPFSYQGQESIIKEVASKYKLVGNNLCFSIKDYDPKRPLIIDPTVFEWSTYIGGNGDSFAFGDQFFHEGEFLYICGMDSETIGDFNYPTTPGSYPPDPTYNNVRNLVVSKFDTLGNLIFSTYLPIDNEGTKSQHYAFDNNSIFFSLELSDNTNFLPGISSTAFDIKRSINSSETIVGRLNSDGILAWTTYLGGASLDRTAGISAADGIVAVGGQTFSDDFPMYQANFPSLSGVSDGFISKFDYDGNILYSSYLGVPNPSFSRGNNSTSVITKNGYTAITFFLEKGVTFPITESPAPVLYTELRSLGHIIYDSNNSVQYSTQYNNEGMRIADVDFDGQNLCINTLQQGNSGFVTPGAYVSNNTTGFNVPHLYCIDVPNASIDFASYTLENAIVESNGQINVENGFVYQGGIKQTEGENLNEVYIQKFDIGGNLIFQNDFNFTASRFADIEIYDGEALIYVDATPNDNLFTPTPDAAQLNPLSQDNISSYIMRTDVNGNYTYGTWISGLERSNILDAFVYNGSIYATGVALTGFPVTVEAFQILNGTSQGTATVDSQGGGDFYVLKINNAKCIDDFSPENIIQPELIEVCMNGTVPFIDGPIITVDEDSIPHYLIDGILTPADNNFFLNYQWQISFVGSSDWVDISGATNPAYQPQPLVDDAEFRRIVYLEYGECLYSDTSNLSLVDVNEFYAPDLPPDTVYYKCATSSILLDVTAAGGTPPYNYNWTPSFGLSNPNSPTPFTNASQSTIYNVEVTDSNGCLFIEQFTVRVYEADAGDEMIACIGTGVQIGTPHIAPGVEGFRYNWSPTTGLSDPNIAQPIANPPGSITYTLSLTGPDNCTVTDDILVEPVQTIADAGDDITFCLGSSVQIGEPADSDFDFVWSPSLYLDNNLLSNPTIDPDELPLNNPMTYYVTKIHKVTGCTDFDSIQVYVNRAEGGIDFCGPRFIGAGDHSSGLANFQWTVISGDASSINGQENIPTPFVAPNQSTLYQLDVTWNGVTCTDQVLVPECGCLIPNAGANSDFNCEVGDTNYNTTIFASSIDTSRYNYLWAPSAGIPDPTSPFVQNFTISLTTATLYTLTATLKTNPSISCSSSVLLFPAPPPFPFAHAVDTITCLGEGINIGGPTIAGWTATWTPDNGTLNQTSIFDPIATPTELTSYVVTIEEISSECQIKDTAVVEIFEIVADTGPDASFCENSIVQLGTPAIPGLVYSWEPSLGLENSDMAQPIDTIFATTTYYLTVSDSANTCSVTDTLVYTIVNNPVANAGEDIVICQGGLGSQIGTPAISGNTYAWSPTTGLSNPNIAQPFANPTSNTIYTLTVANNAEGCFSTDAITITVSNGEAVDAGPNAIVCFNEMVQIGTSPSESGYFYSWTPATGLDNPSIPQPTATVTDTITYTVTVTSPTGCMVQDTVSLMPSVPFADAGDDIHTCPSTEVIIGTPALPGYSYSWSPTTGLDNPLTAQPSLTASINQVYTITATDENNCETTDMVSITVESIVVDAGPDRSVCSSGVSIGTASQGTDFIYNWSPSSSLNNGNIAQPTAMPSIQTTYTVTMTQISTGCIATDMVTVSPIVAAAAGEDQIVCTGHSVLLGAPSIPGSTYSWSPAIGLDNPNIAQPTAVVTTSIVYTLTVTNGACISVDEVELSLEPNPDITLNDFEALCLGACVEIGTMASPFYRYSWSPSVGLNDPSISNPIACPTMTTIYNLIVTDLSTGCSTEENVTVNVANNPPPKPDAGLDKELCPGENTQIGAINQNMLYAYSWSPSTHLTNPFAPITDVILPGGAQGSFTYVLTATDVESGCQGQDTVIININENPNTPLIPDVQSCQNSIINLCEACVEDPDYSYAWSPGNLVSDSTALSVSLIVEHTTIFELIITDNTTGCNSSLEVQVDLNSIASPNSNAGIDQTLCLDEVVSIGQSDNGDTYTWYPENLRPLLSNAFISNPVFSPLDTGSFILWLEVENVSGCMSIDTINLNVFDDAQIDAGTSFFTCELQATLTASTNNVEGEWSLFSGPNIPVIASPTDSITGVSAMIPGTYRFAWTITSTNVCNKGGFDLVTIEVLGDPIPDAGPDLDLCVDESSLLGQADQGLIYTWFPVELRNLLSDAFISDPVFTSNEAGEFTFWLEAENIAGCSTIDSVSITVLERVEVDAGDALSTCDTEITLVGRVTIGDGVWVSLGGPSTPLIHSPNNATTLVSQIVPGTYSFAYSSTSDQVCNLNELDLVSVEILETPNADAGQDFIICDDEIITIGPDEGTDFYEWFPIDQRANLSNPFIRNPEFTPSDAGSFDFWVEVTNADGCVDIDSLVVEVMGYASISVVTPIVTCQTEVNLSATIQNGIGEWTFTSGPSVPNIEDDNDPLTLISNLIPGLYTLTWTIISEEVCNTGDFERIRVEVLEAPIADVQIVCGTTNNLPSFTYTISVDGHGALGTYNLSGFDNQLGLTYEDVHGPFGPFIIDNASYELIISADGSQCEDMAEIIVPGCGTTDYGDLPDTAAGNSPGNYETYSYNNGPSHRQIDGLRLASLLDTENEARVSTDARGDGADEDLYLFINGMEAIKGAIYILPLEIQNFTGNTGYVEIWVDWNGDGDFMDLDEMVLDVSDNGFGTFLPATWNLAIPDHATENQDIGMRIRLSLEDNMTPNGPVNSGEVEDYLFRIVENTDLCLPIFIRLAN